MTSPLLRTVTVTVRPGSPEALCRTLLVISSLSRSTAVALTVLASVRQRRREFAVLKSLGLRRGQVRAIVTSQAITILAVATLVGAPLGVAGGRWAWTTFANSIGVVPAPVVPVTTLALGIGGLIAAGALLALWPAAIAARTVPAALLRAEG